jgi:ankyrin repeat protein
MYRSILWQLLRQQPALFRHVIPDFEIQHHQLFESAQSLTRVLPSILDDPKLPGVFLVLDAFDECDENSQHGILRNFCSLLKQGRSSTSRKLKILITSRTYDGICGLDEHPSIVLTPENLQTDISNYVKQRVQEIARVRHYNVSLAARVEEFVSSESNGMFLWASLILKDLEKTPLRAVDSKLRSPPKGLWHVYDSLLQAMHDDVRETTRDILSLVVTAIRPLTLHELAMVMRFQRDKKACPRYDSSLADIEGDIQLCGPILVIRDDSVHLVHQSAKDFLVVEAEHAKNYPSLDYFGVRLKRGHRILAEVCLSYLSSKEFTSGPLKEVQFQYGNDAVIAAHHGKFPLLAYTAACWLQHARLSDVPKELNPRIKLLASEATFMAWFQIYWFSREIYLPYPQNVTPFHMAAHFHLSSYLEEHLSIEGVDALEPVYYGTPLHAAAWAGDSASVEILLKSSAKVDMVGGRYGTALQAAAGNGHEAMVETLLHCGATINAPTMCGAHGNPLLAASLNGYHQIVRLLLEHGAHVNTYQSDGFFNLAFKTAVQKGHKRIVDRLLRADADVHAQAQGVDYGTALQKACENGQEDVVELLLTSGMETEMRKDSAQRYDFGTALQAAVSAERVEVVRLLLDAGADIEARGERNGSALVTAASLGHSELVRILLSAGAQISQVFGGYGNALIAASANGRLDVVRELLEAGADVNQRGGYFGSALRAAATFGHILVVDVLLTAGAEDSSDGVYCGTALEAARENNQLNVVSTLLKHRLGSGSSSRPASDTTMNVEELLAILDGDWRGYYFYSAGNRARDEGEVFFELMSKAAHLESATKVIITGSGEDKWGRFAINGTAEVSSQVEFNKDYEEWGWTYKGHLSKSQQAIGGTWGRAGNDTHGTFAFHRVRDHIN